MSAVWNFFKKKGDSEPVSCNLCGKTYKTCGNTTNLATHLKIKHHFAYLQLAKIAKSVSPLPTLLTPTNTQPASAKDNVDSIPVSSNISMMDRSRVDDVASCSNNDAEQITGNSEVAISAQETFGAKKRKQPTLIDCLERSTSYEEGGQKHCDITQALIYMICKDNLPFSCVDKVGMKRFVRAACPLYKLPSRKKVTHLVERRYSTTKSVLKNTLNEAKFVSLTSDILTLTNSTRSFLVLTIHLLDNVGGSFGLQNISLSAQRLSQAHTGQYIKGCWDEIYEEFDIDKNKIVSVTTDGGANIVAAVRLFLGDEKRIPCMAHLLNLIVDGVLKENQMFSALADHVKSIVTYFKQSVNAMDLLRDEQEASGKKEGEVLTLIQAVNTRWNSCFDMLERFIKLSAVIAKVLATRSQSNRNTPDMVAISQLNVIKDIVTLLGPFKQATEEISGSNYATASLAIPITNLLRQEMEQATPSTNLGVSVKNSLLKGISDRLALLERNTFLAIATILDPRFKRIHFDSPLAVSAAISKISNEIRSEHRRRGQLSPELRATHIAQEDSDGFSIWSRHEKILSQSSITQEIPSSGSVPNELKQYLDQPHLGRKSDPVKFWVDSRHFTPVLSEVAQKYIICQASSVSSERVASTINLLVPDNRSRLTGEHVKQRVLLMSISDEYWLE